ncbi:hypothetical protein GGR38_001279 [Novosphingobium sediminicola]|uniref:Uncharacterized protein n=1 Tax=Novosphingobium sediminicola TaxID=563162 RepID=A0A7W6CMR9_9SPHN|nr:hypothetical protein [Novosphingobium sediminicola]
MRKAQPQPGRFSPSAIRIIPRIATHPARPRITRLSTHQNETSENQRLNTQVLAPTSRIKGHNGVIENPPPVFGIEAPTIAFDAG